MISLFNPTPLLVESPWLGLLNPQWIHVLTSYIYIYIQFVGCRNPYLYIYIYIYLFIYLFIHVWLSHCIQCFLPLSLLKSLIDPTYPYDPWYFPHTTMILLTYSKIFDLYIILYIYIHIPMICPSYFDDTTMWGPLSYKFVSNSITYHYIPSIYSVYI